MPEWFDSLRRQFNDRIGIAEARPGTYQLLLPMAHPDGDPYELYITEGEGDGLLLTDLGITLMRLSYAYDLDTDSKRKIFARILSEAGASEDNGAIILRARPQSLYAAVMEFLRVITQVSTMQLYRREVVRDLFYEELDEYMKTDLGRFLPNSKTLPIPARPELEVDYQFAAPKPLFVFGIKDGAKARLATIACLEFRNNRIPFRGVAVHEDFEALTPTDRSLLTNVIDKQFTDLADFKRGGVEYLERERA